MPLSEEELRLLEQMERALVAEDPKFVSLIRGTDHRRARRRRAVLATLGLTLGVVALVGGVVWRTTFLGLVGFALMLTATVIGLGAVRHRRPASPSPDFEAAMFRHPSHGATPGPDSGPPRPFRGRWWRRDDRY